MVRFLRNYRQKKKTERCIVPLSAYDSSTRIHCTRTGGDSGHHHKGEVPHSWSLLSLCEAYTQHGLILTHRVHERASRNPVATVRFVSTQCSGAILGPTVEYNSLAGTLSSLLASRS